MKTIVKHLLSIQLLIGLILLTNSLSAQNTTRIQIIHADAFSYDVRRGKNIQRLIGKVELKQDSTLFYSDSAYLNDKEKDFEGFGHIHINVNDTLHLYGDRLFYHGKEYRAELFGHVVLQDEKARLETSHLVFNRKTHVAYYDQQGVIYSDSNVLKSKHAYYNTRSKIFHFQKEVNLSNRDQVTNADTLIYNTNNKTAYFRGPTTIKGSKSTIRCTRGWYDTGRDISKLTQRPEIESNGQFLSADSLQYNNHTTYGRAFGRIRINDTLHRVIVEGRVGEMWDKKGMTYVTDSALAITYDQSDSLFIHADTMWVYFDIKRQAKKMLAYRHVRFYRNDLQGKCDSMGYAMSDSSMKMYGKPILWTGKNQLTADSMHINISRNQIDSLVLYHQSFIVSQDSTSSFNQISGRNMTGFFKQNQIYKMNVDGNAQSIYWVRDENKKLVGVNKAEASNMIIRIANNEIKAINYLENPSETMLPEKKLKKEDRYLKGFRWFEMIRPKNKTDIFRITH